MDWPCVATRLGGGQELVDALVSLKWSDLDIKRRKVHVQRSIWEGPGGERFETTPKSGKGRTVDMTEALHDALSSLPRHLGKDRVLYTEAAVTTGASQSIRAVLTTAAVAGLGFLPMALSTSAGSEVQRPPATVVIVGIFFSTALTLLVLPSLLTILLKGWVEPVDDDSSETELVAAE